MVVPLVFANIPKSSVFLNPYLAIHHNEFLIEQSLTRIADESSNCSYSAAFAEGRSINAAINCSCPPLQMSRAQLGRCFSPGGRRL